MSGRTGAGIRWRQMTRVVTFVVARWRPNWHWAVFASGAMLTASALDAAAPFFVGRLVDGIAGPADAAIREAVFFIAAILGAAVARPMSLAAITELTTRIMEAVGREAFRHIQRLGAEWHANTFAGTTVRQMTRGMWAVDLIDDALIAEFLSATGLLVATLAAAGLRSGWVALFLAVYAAAHMTLTVLLSVRWIMPGQRLAAQADSRIGGAVADAIAGNATVRSFAAEEREDERVGLVLAKWRHRTRRAWMQGSLNAFIQNISLVLLQAGTVAVSLVLWRRGSFGPGDVAFVITAAMLLRTHLGEIARQFRNFQRAVNEMEELIDIVALEPAIADRPEAPALVLDRARITFEGVGFRYPGQKRPIFEALSIDIQPGEKVGLVGASGAGKSSFVKLLQRIHDVDCGRIAIDGQDIREVRLASLRRSIALVPQDPVLFHRTIAENIAYGRPNASMEEIERAARLAHVDLFVKALPKGYATMVGERGVKLSGGERQRVAIARALLADAPILILDEATSSLDVESEALIRDALETLMKGRTTIVIAHRLSTVTRLDRILVFDKGRIVEDGPHAELLSREAGVYRRLFERQEKDLSRAA